MTESVVTEDSSLQILTPIKDKISEYTCKTCSAYESQFKKVFEELESARVIIDILQREALKTTTMESTCDELLQRNGPQYHPEITRVNQIKAVYGNLRQQINTLRLLIGSPH